MSVLSNFPAGLKRLRKSKGFSQEKLSLAAGIDKSYISMLERGKRSPSLATLSKISTALGIEAWELIKHIDHR